jgi:hypothetical protein
MAIINGNVYLSDIYLFHIPSFLHGVSKINGDFDCADNQLKSLHGAPRTIGNRFICNFNRIESLEGAPITVGGDFWCMGNRIGSLKGIPKVGGGFLCFANPREFTFEEIALAMGVPCRNFDIYKASSPV